MTPPVRGARVSVPLGSRVVTGIAIGAAEIDENGLELKDILSVLDEEPFLPPAVVDLAMWVSEYYACGPGDALSAAMPPAKAHKTVRLVMLSDDARGKPLDAARGKQKA